MGWDRMGHGEAAHVPAAVVAPALVNADGARPKLRRTTLPLVARRSALRWRGGQRDVCAWLGEVAASQRRFGGVGALERACIRHDDVRRGATAEGRLVRERRDGRRASVERVSHGRQCEEALVEGGEFRRLLVERNVPPAKCGKYEGRWEVTSGQRWEMRDGTRNGRGASA
jgi:hypothetical protein